MASIPPIEVNIKTTEMPEDAAPSRYQAKFWMVYRNGSSEMAIGAETLEELFLAADCQWPLDQDCKSEGTFSEKLVKAREERAVQEGIELPPQKKCEYYARLTPERRKLIDDGIRAWQEDVVKSLSVVSAGVMPA